MSLSYLHNKPSTKLLPQLHYAHAKHCTDCMCNQGKTVDSSRLLSLTFGCCDDKAVLPGELTSSCASCAQLWVTNSGALDKAQAPRKAADFLQLQRKGPEVWCNLLSKARALAGEQVWSFRTTAACYFFTILTLHLS